MTKKDEEDFIMTTMPRIATALESISESLVFFRKSLEKDIEEEKNCSNQPAKVCDKETRPPRRQRPNKNGRKY